MIILDSPDKVLEALLSVAITTNQLPFMCNYVDAMASPYGYAEADGATNSLTAVTISGDLQKVFSQRRIKYLCISNTDSAANILTIRLNNAGTYRTIFRTYLSPGDTAYYEDGHGWYVMDQFGSLKTPTEQEMESVTLAGIDTYTGIIPGLLAYTDMLTIKGRFLNACTGPSTVNINGMGAKSLKTFGTDAVGASDGYSDIKNNQILIIVFDLSNDWFQIQSVTCRIPNSV